MKLVIDLAGVAEYWPMVNATANPELVRSLLLGCLQAHLRILLPGGKTDVLGLLEHAVRVNGVDVQP